ncbi:MAG: hypothetical protein HY606_10775 [Planctomycetes bacterium]|nr:hypothetical protein [Planctomycetota bacterium]
MNKGLVSYWKFMFILLLGAVLLAQDREGKGKEKGEQTVEILINPALKHQEIAGFGASQAFQASKIMALPENVRKQIFDLLFTEQGAHISILRNQIEPTYKFKGNDFPQVEDKWQYLIIKEALSRGVSHLYSVPWTPPAYMKNNQKTDDTAKKNFDPDLPKSGTVNFLPDNEYLNYAKYLTDYVKGYKKSVIEIKTIGLQNEPDFTTNYNSCVWSKVQLTEFTKVVRRFFVKAGLAETQIMLGEATGWKNSTKYAGYALKDEEAKKAIAIVASHGYGGGKNWELADLAREHKKQVWQTEFSTLKGGDESLISIEDGLKWAGVMIDDLTRGYVNAWLYWWLVEFMYRDKYAGQSLLLVKTDTNEVVIPKRFWTFSHFSRFARPGTYRVDISSFDNVKTVGFIDEQTKSLVVTLLNNSGSQIVVNSKLLNCKVKETVLVYRTSKEEDMKQIDNLQVQNQGLQISLPPKSLTTCILQVDVGGSKVKY